MLVTVLNGEVNWRGGRDQCLEAVEAVARQVLGAGRAVVCHCNHGYHRSPLGWAVLLYRLCRY